MKLAYARVNKLNKSASACSFDSSAKADSFGAFGARPIDILATFQIEIPITLVHVSIDIAFVTKE